MAISGYGGIAKVGANTIAQVKQWELPLAADLYDTSSLGSQWKTYVPGLLGAEAKLDLFLDLTDTQGQVALQGAILGSTSITLNLVTSNAGGATAHTYTGTAFVKSWDVKDPVNAPEEVSATVTYSGQISFS